jgi:hypothetical protein
MDWLKGKSKPETIDFPIKIMGFSCKFSLKPIHWEKGWTNNSNGKNTALCHGLTGGRWRTSGIDRFVLIRSICAHAMLPSLHNLDSSGFGQSKLQRRRTRTSGMLVSTHSRFFVLFSVGFSDAFFGKKVLRSKTCSLQLTFFPQLKNTLW